MGRTLIILALAALFINTAGADARQVLSKTRARADVLRTVQKNGWSNIYVGHCVRRSPRAVACRVKIKTKAYDGDTGAFLGTFPLREAYAVRLRQDGTTRVKWLGGKLEFDIGTEG